MSIVYDDDGRITAAQEVTTASGKTTIKLVPGPGQHHIVLDAPSHHSGKAFSDVVHHLKVAKASGSPSLVDR
jgi:hypothetical protein